MQLENHRRDKDAVMNKQPSEPEGLPDSEGAELYVVGELLRNPMVGNFMFDELFMSDGLKPNRRQT